MQEKRAFFSCSKVKLISLFHISQTGTMSRKRTPKIDKF